MTIQEKVRQAVENLPADASFEDAMERLLFMAKLERGLQQSEDQNTLSHEAARERMAKWLK
ncbi:MAG: hypothetical protein HYV27_02675 [Candidatus Hydrogenedentes bacterium]|nr:hypothetical protein [Candidatus Hydrogenedentota bacterium]